MMYKIELSIESAKQALSIVKSQREVLIEQLRVIDKQIKELSEAIDRSEIPDIRPG